MRKKELSLSYLDSKIKNLSKRIDKLNFSEYMSIFKDKKKLLYYNFIAGLARGFGMAIGFSILGAIGIYILAQLAESNLPIIGDFVTELVKIVNQNMN